LERLHECWPKKIRGGKDRRGVLIDRRENGKERVKESPRGRELSKENRGVVGGVVWGKRTKSHKANLGVWKVWKIKKGGKGVFITSRRENGGKKKNQQSCLC